LTDSGVYQTPSVGRVRSPAYRLRPSQRSTIFNLLVPRDVPLPRVCGRSSRELDGARYGRPVSGVLCAIWLIGEIEKEKTVVL